jgi:hypothetical protein
MGRTLTIQKEDEARIESLRKQLGLKTQIEVIRMALNLLEFQISRQSRVKRWQRAAKIIRESGS